MSAYYFDSSALVKCYAREVGTDWVRGLISSPPVNDLFTALVTGAEIVAALKRRERMNLVTATETDAALAMFQRQFRTRVKALRTSDAVVNRAMELAEQHKLRGYDAIQLASASLIGGRIATQGFGPLTMISSDNDLNIAARAEGLLTDDPNLHP